MATTKQARTRREIVEQAGKSIKHFATIAELISELEQVEDIDRMVYQAELRFENAKAEEAAFAEQAAKDRADIEQKAKDIISEAERAAKVITDNAEKIQRDSEARSANIMQATNDKAAKAIAAMDSQLAALVDKIAEAKTMSTHLDEQVAIKAAEFRDYETKLSAARASAAAMLGIQDIK